MGKHLLPNWSPWTRNRFTLRPAKGARAMTARWAWPGVRIGKASYLFSEVFELKPTSGLYLKNPAHLSNFLTPRTVSALPNRPGRPSYPIIPYPTGRFFRGTLSQALRARLRAGSLLRDAVAELSQQSLA